MWKVVTLLVLAAQGLGHIMAPQSAFAPPGALTPKAAGLGGLTISSPAGHALALFWLVPMVGFLAGTYGIWAGQDWWRPVLAISAVTSVVSVLPWIRVMPMLSYLGALLIDVLVLVGIFTPVGDQFIRSITR